MKTQQTKLVSNEDLFVSLVKTAHENRDNQDIKNLVLAQPTANHEQAGMVMSVYDILQDMHPLRWNQELRILAIEYELPTSLVDDVFSISDDT